MSRSDGVQLRHAPVQERGARRFESLLDAAETIIATEGYAALTLTAVAERSGSSIGSLYRFFSSKEQLVDALAQRIAAAIDANPVPPPAAPMETLDRDAFVDWMMHTLERTIERHPALPGLLSHFGAHCKPLEDRAGAPVDAFLRARAPRLTPSERELSVRMAMKVMESGLTLGEQIPGTPRAAVLNETRAALSSYLASKL